MPIATIRGANILYDVIGTGGPWVALSPGGRRERGAVADMAGRIAAAGYRVLIHDRRNCGLSDVSIEGDDSEYEIWADDLYELLKQRNALPAYVGGSSSGSRLSLLLALRHPDAVKGLLLWRITGGRFACERLAADNYTQYIDAAQQGGMRAVCGLGHFKDLCQANPSNLAYLIGLDPKRFIAVMTRWRECFTTSADLPIVGATEADLRSITIPTLVIPGNDRTHPMQAGLNAARFIPGAELKPIWDKEVDAPMAPPEDWAAKEGEIASLLTDFLKQTEAR